MGATMEHTLKTLSRAPATTSLLHQPTNLDACDISSRTSSSPTMATPTPTIPSLPSHPSSASKRAAGHVSTPSHLGFSPAPRSVPSPATTRKDHAGKTPINHPTTSSHGSKTLGGTPMIHSLSQQGHPSGSSPGANMPSFGTPIGLGVEGITPSAFNMHTPAMAGVPMGLTMSELGVNAGAGAPKRNEDEERHVKMRKVLKRIGKPKGRVSQEAIARISRRVGFDNAIEPNLVSIAGKKVLIDVALKEERPESVSTVFATENAGLQAQTEAVGKVLLEDLQKAGDVTLTARLDHFATNLERLASIDRLSSEHFDAFEALSGVYTSLRRLYEQEVAAASELEVLRRKSGRPEVHADGRIGVKIAYWPTRDEEADTSGEAGFFGLNLGIERSSSTLYPSLRVSDSWLPDPLELPAPDAPQTTPWQDPPPTLIPSSAEGDAMAVDGQASLPELRFTAKLDPPIILPWQLATNLLQTFGLPAPQLFVYPPAWHAMLLDPSTTTPFNTMSEHVVTSEQSVLAKQDGEEAETTHAYSLDFAKRDGGHKLQELPFSHPRQLVEILPTLRQWACFGSLVKSLFSQSTASGTKTAVNGPPNGPRKDQQALSLDDLLTPPTTPPARDDKLAVSVSLATSPVPTLSFVFQAAKGEDVCNVTVQVLQNGVLSLTSAEGLGGEGAMEGVQGEEGKKLAGALEACEGDVGVWVEWLRSRGR